MIILHNDDVIEYIQKNEEFIKNQLKDNDEEVNEKNICEAANYLIDEDHMVLRDYIKIFDDYIKFDKIRVEADLGLWYGRRKAFKNFDNLFKAFYACVEDINKVFFTNKRSTLNLEAIHHDGVNKFKFYKIINNKKYALTLDDLTKY